MNIDVIEAQGRFEIATAHMMASAYVETIEPDAAWLLDTLAEDIEAGRTTAVLTMINGFPATVGLVMPQAVDGTRTLRCGFTHPECRDRGAWAANLDRRIALCDQQGAATRFEAPADPRIQKALSRRGFVDTGDQGLTRAATTLRRKAKA